MGNTAWLIQWQANDDSIRWFSIDGSDIVWRVDVDDALHLFRQVDADVMIKHLESKGNTDKLVATKKDDHVKIN